MRTKISPAKRLESPGKKPIQVPGDKSVSHRALLFGALARGTTEIRNLLGSADVLSTGKCLEALGVRIERKSETVLVHGNAGKLSEPTRDLDCGNSGTTMRLLMGILSGHAISCRLIGDDSLQGRPMRRIAEPLRRMGAEIVLHEDNFAPLSIRGASLRAIQYELPVASAQLKSAVLLAGLFAEGTTRLSGKLQSRDHTERLLPHFGVTLEVSESLISIEGGQPLQANDLRVPGDISSAAFWMVAASLVPGSRLEIENVSMNESRQGLLGVLRRMGASVETSITAEHPEPVGLLRISSNATGRRLQGVTIEGAEVPALIDEIPVLAVLATQAEGETVIRDAEELRVKETDRIEAIAVGLRSMGVQLETRPDGLVIRGPQKLRGAKINSFHDHRIAMAFSIAGLIAEGDTEIDGSECVDISYPTFYETLRRLLGA